MGGLYTYLWGMHAWIFLHSIVLQREGEEINSEYTMKFFNLLHMALPCDGCSSHYMYNYKNLSIKLEDASKDIKLLEDWIVLLHNEVNKTRQMIELSEEEDVLVK